jgi:hypothetical protein
MKAKCILFVAIVSGLLLLFSVPASAAAPQDPFYWTAGQPQVTVAQGDTATFHYVVVNSNPGYPAGQAAQTLAIFKQDGRKVSYPVDPVMTVDLGVLLNPYSAWDYPANVEYPLLATLAVDLPPGSYLWQVYVPPFAGYAPSMRLSHLTVLPGH